MCALPSVCSVKLLPSFAMLMLSSGHRVQIGEKREREKGRWSNTFLQFLTAPKDPNVWRNIPFYKYFDMRGDAWNAGWP